MLVVALLLIHTLLVQGYNGNPWKFGGYGMFSTMPTRYLDAKIVDDDGRYHHLYQSRIRKALTRPHGRARNLPNPSGLCDLAQQLSALRWTAEKAELNGQVRHAAAAYNDTHDPLNSVPVSLDGVWFAKPIKRNDASSVIRIATIEVRVAELRYDPEASHTHRHPISSVVWSRDGKCQIP